MFIWLAVVLGIMWMVEQSHGYTMPIEARVFIMGYLVEGVAERAYRKSKGDE